MNIKRILLLLLLAGVFIFAGCSKGEILGDNMPSGKLVSLKVPANYYASNDLSYFYVNSMEGKLLNVSEIQKSTINVFEVDKSKNGPANRYNFSRLFAYDNGTYKNITIYTYIGMLPFSKEFKASAASTFIGTAMVKFTNVPAYTSFLLAGANSNITSGTLSTGTFYISLYSNLPAGLFIKLKTSTGELYKSVEGLVAGQTTTISLSGMVNTFGTKTISFNNSTYTSSSISIDRQAANNFTSGSYTVFSSSISGTPLPASVIVSYPMTFLPTGYCRTNFTNSGTSKYSTATIYSTAIPDNIKTLDGTIKLTGKYPGKVSYTLNVPEKVDVLIFYWSHSSAFRSANGFNVTYIVYVSPSVREFQLPVISADIMKGVSSKYSSIKDLKLAEMLPTYAYIYESAKALDFDDWMNKYWFGWGDPVTGQIDRNMYINTSGVKKGTISYEPVKDSELNDRDRGY
jgi:hypothetical protein